MQTKAFRDQSGAARRCAGRVGARSGRTVCGLLKLAAICVIVASAALGASLESRRESVTRLVRAIQKADYEGDRAALKGLYQDLLPFADDKELGTKVRYWCGF